MQRLFPLWQPTGIQAIRRAAHTSSWVVLAARDPEYFTEYLSHLLDFDGTITMLQGEHMNSPQAVGTTRGSLTPTWSHQHVLTTTLLRECFSKPTSTCDGGVVT